MSDDDIKNAQERGQILAEVKNLTGWIQSLDSSVKEFKVGIGTRVGELERDSNQMKTKMDFLMWILARITTPILGLIGIAIVGALAWKMAH